MNLPNLLTILRIFFVPLLVAALVQEDWRIQFLGLPVPQEYLALATFLAAALTDLLDGYLARRWKQVTTVGTLLDPVADKLLISAALISLVQIRLIPGWLAILIIAREFAVSGLRSIASSEGYTIKASDLGKTKMAMQVIAISLMLVSIRYKEWYSFAMLWMYGVVFFALVSAIQYFGKFWEHIDGQTKQRRRRELIKLEGHEKIERRRQRRQNRIKAPDSPSGPHRPPTPAR
ncbi:MAG: CDP-diacylglycerol--glycerol-3-phosphate 3-phosphatidyltransferase [Acidobacteriota bacterium]|jgi:CDP-diacylglycerol--glycerol-3-phosphate 3-phosphatidyltransferase|nr:CDP-diacylglycerol--glycerol-3-phosphate 3-phosphatidyltransferase [Bryobacteraceae bacterium CoA2 C42]MCA2963662.1 CDP-diacylglycerol--glycerol-3-phosphate 3-phosphatidyltransferase [Acidobacteriaceae bacterium]